MVFLVYSFLFFFFCDFLFSQEKKINGVVAVVGNKPIFASDVDKKILKIGQQYLSMGVDFEQELHKMSQKEKDFFKKDVLDLLVGNQLFLIAAEQDTNISARYDDVMLFLDNEFQDLIDRDFGGSVFDFEKKHQTTKSKYIASNWESGEKRYLIEYKKEELMSGVGVTKKEIFNAFEFYKKENPFIPQSFSFSLYHSPVFPEEEDLELKLKKLSAIKDSLLSGQLLFEDAFKRHSKKTIFGNGKK